MLRTGGAAVTLSLAAGLDMPSFVNFAQKHGREYMPDSMEFEERQKVYDDRVKRAVAQNSKPGHLWTAGPNEFWDWKADELSTLFGRSGRYSVPGADIGHVTKHGFLQHGNGTRTATSANSTAWPQESSWLHLSSLQWIRNQGPCGSCWAIAAATLLESVIDKERQQRVAISPQQLVSCVPNPQKCGGEGGCKGATVELALQYILENGAQVESQVPYKGTDLESCKMAPDLTYPQKFTKDHFGFTSWRTLTENSYSELMTALTTGPVAVSVAATGWVDYSFGIFDGCPQWDAVVDHAVVAVGYGVDTKTGHKFWHIQNSWGMWWGENGRIRLLRQDNDATNCGTNNKPELGTGCAGGPPSVPVCGMCGVLYDSVIATVQRR